MDGYGEFHWNDNSKYIGMYVKDKKEGFGIFYWPKNEKIYAGYWKNGKQNGPGTLFTKNGTKYYHWENEKIIKKYKFLWMLQKMEDIPQKHLRFFKMDYNEISNYIDMV
jgi:hypothetical protein